MKPKYNKPPLTLEEQADKMLSRNLQGISKSELVRYLNVVNYYRLRGYTYPYQNNETNEEKKICGIRLGVLLESR